MSGQRDLAISADFLKDLDHVREVLHPVPCVEELRRLGEILDQVYRTAHARMVERVQALDPDSPLRCPVSAFGSRDAGKNEGWHTRLLAWLLDPQGEHGFGSALLKGFLDRVGISCQDREPACVTSMPERSVEGGKKIDIWVEGCWEGGTAAGAHESWLVVIECKVKGGEGPGQLGCYAAAVGQEPARTTRMVFLTPEGREPTSEDWVPLSFLELAQVLWQAGRDRRDAPGFALLKHYLVTILRDVLEVPLPFTEESPALIVNYCVDEEIWSFS